MRQGLKDRVITFLTPYVKRGEISLMDLLRVTQNVDHVFQNGRRLLHEVISKGDVELTEEVLKQGASTSDFYLQHVLSSRDVSFEKQNEILKLLLKARADANSIFPEEFFEKTSHLSPHQKILLAEPLIKSSNRMHRTSWLRSSLSFKSFEMIPLLLLYDVDVREKEGAIISRFGEIIEAFFRSHEYTQEILELNRESVSCFVRTTGSSAEQFATLPFPEKQEYLTPFRSSRLFSRENSEFFRFFFTLAYLAFGAENLRPIAENTKKVSPEYQDIVGLVLCMVAYKIDVREVFYHKPIIRELADKVDTGVDAIEELYELTNH